MSMAQFDDLYEICCGRMEEEEVLLKSSKPEETPVVAEASVTTKWWEEALKEIERESENEYELYPI
ncbi:hypothetical protein R4Z10_11515 [Niallia sp. XMNu-256]|uniref:hypothetical protein n=1 Tax=Niallia sp. XMNu-256 TaxID=3082444 RepID=UPI0030CFBF19